MISAETGFAYSRGKNKTDNTPEQRWEPDFPSFREAVLADRGTDRGQQWIAAPFREAPDDDVHRAEPTKAAAIGRPHRCKPCALPRRWGAADIDGDKPGRPALTPESLSYLIQLLQPYSAFVYTTASHTDAVPRIRVIFELSTAVARSELIRVTKAFRERLDAQMIAGGYSPLPWDDSCDKPEQPLYLPLESAEFYIAEGAPVCVEELLAAAEPEVATDLRRPPAACVSGQPDTYSLSALAHAVRAVIAAPEGTRNDLINREGYTLGGLVSAGRLPRTLVETVLISATREAGWDNSAKTEATISRALTQGELLPRLEGQPTPIIMAFGQADQRTDKLKLVDLGGLRAANIEPPSFVLEPIVPRGTLTLFAGHGGSGKSLLALIWAAHVACGRDWGRFCVVEPMRVLFASLEDPGQVMAYRLRSIVEVYDLDYDLIQQNLAIADGADMDAALVSEVAEAGVRHLRPTPRLAELAELAEGAELIVIDNASDTFDGDENNRRQVRYFIRHLARMARANNAGMVLLAHIDKAAAIHGSNGNSYSGSTAWHNSARSRLALEGGGCLVLRHEKANLSALAEDVNLEWKATSTGARVLVPIHGGNVGATEMLARQTENDANRLLLMLASAAGAGIEVPAAMSGSYTAAHAIGHMKELPAVFRSSKGRKRIFMAVTELLRTGRLHKVEVKTSSRNTKLVLELTQTGAAEVARVRASNPHTPSVTDARAGERASVVCTPLTDATHATDATQASELVFNEYAPSVMYAELGSAS